MKQTYGHLVALAQQIKYPGLEWKVYEKAQWSPNAGLPGAEPTEPPIYWGRWECLDGPLAVDNATGQAAPWYGRKWLLSAHMVDSEVVQTAWAALMMCLEHEAREHFTFMGTDVFNPHLDIYKVLDLRKSEALDKR